MTTTVAPGDEVPRGARRRRAEIACVTGIAAKSIFALALLRLTPSLLGTDPVLLEVLRGSTSAMASGGDVISLFWFTNSAASSARIYWENRSAAMAGPKLAVPVAVTVFPRDIPRLPRSWIEDTYSDLVHLGQVDAGGHFAPPRAARDPRRGDPHRLEEPALLI